jgi:hypothetical protein
MKYRSNSILALIPQSNEGERLLQQVLFFQQSLQMRVFLLNIIHPIGWFTRSFQPKKAVKIKMTAKEELKDFAAKVFRNNIPDDYILRVQVGKKVPVLVNESQKGGYEFIVIDKSCDNYPGSFCKIEVDKFISRSFCPVLAINKDFQVHEIKKIIVPIDISQPTKKRLYWATYFAKKIQRKNSDCFCAERRYQRNKKSGPQKCRKHQNHADGPRSGVRSGDSESTTTGKPQSNFELHRRRKSGYDHHSHTPGIYVCRGQNRKICFRDCSWM